MNLRWKILTWIYGVLVILAFISNFNRLNFFHAVYFPFSLFEIIGLFGYSYKKTIFKNTFWKIFFFIDVVKQIVFFAILLLKFPIWNILHVISVENICYIITFLITYFLILYAILFPLFQYSFRNYEGSDF